MEPFRPLVPADTDALLRRLADEEEKILSRMAEIEERIRTFEDLDRPAYETWLRIELGPLLETLEELHARIHERRVLVQRVNELVQSSNLHPREALHLATSKESTEADEIDARRQARREAKRETRRARKKEIPGPRSGTGETPRDRPPRPLLSLYRDLARSLHPDSPLAIRSLPPARALNLWHEVQTAYNTGNLAALTGIKAWLIRFCGGEEKLAPKAAALTYGERAERLRTMFKSCAKLENSLSQHALHPAWEFRSLPGKRRQKLRRKAARELDQELERTQEVLDALDDFIESIGPARPPRRPGR